MGLEDQIQQKKFVSETEKAIVNISYTHSYLSNLINTALKEHNISVQQFNVLRILKGQDPKPVSINEITLRMVDKMSNASRLVHKLHAKQLVQRSVCSYDKRQVDVTLTKEGAKVLQTLNVLVDTVIHSHNGITIEEYQQLNLLLDKLRND